MIVRVRLISVSHQDKSLYGKQFKKCLRFRFLASISLHGRADPYIVSTETFIPDAVLRSGVEQLGLEARCEYKLVSKINHDLLQTYPSELFSYFSRRRIVFRCTSEYCRFCSSVYSNKPVFVLVEKLPIATPTYLSCSSAVRCCRTAVDL